MDNAIDFLPDRLRERRARTRRLVRQVVLLATGTALMAVWIGLAQRNVAQARAELEVLRGRSANLQRVLAEREQLQKQQADLLLKQQISERLGSRAGALDVLAELERLVPPGVTLTSLHLDGVQVALPGEAGRPVPAVRAEGADARARAGAGPAAAGTVNRMQLVLTGIAPGDVEVANLIGQLSASPLLENVSMGYLRGQVVQGRRAREFQVSCHVVR